MRTDIDKATILRLRPFSEYDTILSVFSEKSGKKIVLAKGLRRPKSRLSGIIQPFSTISFEYSLPRTESSFARLIRADLFSKPPKHADTSLFFLSEISEKLSREGQATPVFFELLQEISFAKKYFLLPVIFLLKALTFFGYFPEFGFCSRTGKDLESGGKWLSSGEMVHCSVADAGVGLSFTEIKILRFWQKNSLLAGEKVLVSAESREKYMQFLLRFLEEEQGIFLKTKECVM